MTATTCTVGPCADDRAPGSLYCRRHGPTEKAQTRLSPPSSTATPGHDRFPWRGPLIAVAVIVWIGLFFVIGVLGNLLLGAALVGVMIAVRREGAKAQAEANRTTAIKQGAAAMVCPHCQTVGHVSGKRVTRKAGVNGAKLGRALHGSPEGALGGMAAKETITELSCSNCGMTWTMS